MTETRSSNARKRAKAKARAATAASPKTAAPAKAQGPTVSLAPKGGAKKAKKAVVAPPPPVEEPAAPSPGKKKKKKKRVHKRKGSTADVEAAGTEPEVEDPPPAKKPTVRDIAKRKAANTKELEVVQETPATSGPPSTRKRKKSGTDVLASADTVKMKAGRKEATPTQKPEQQEKDEHQAEERQPKRRTTRAALAATAATDIGVAETLVAADLPAPTTTKSKRKRKAKAPRTTSKEEEPDAENEPKLAEGSRVRKSARLSNEGAAVNLPVRPVRRIVSLAKVKGLGTQITDTAETDKLEKDDLDHHEEGIPATPMEPTSSPPGPTEDTPASVKDGQVDSNEDSAENADEQVDGTLDANSAQDSFATDTIHVGNDAVEDENMAEEIEGDLNRNDENDDVTMDSADKRDDAAPIESSLQSSETVRHDPTEEMEVEGDDESAVSIDPATDIAQGLATDDGDVEGDAMSEGSIQGSEVFSLEELDQKDNDTEYGDLGIDHAIEAREREKAVDLGVEPGEESDEYQEGDGPLPDGEVDHHSESDDERVHDEEGLEESDDDDGVDRLNESFIGTQEDIDEELTDSDVDEEPGVVRSNTAVLDMLPGVGVLYSNDEEDFSNSEPSVNVLSDTESENDDAQDEGEHDLEQDAGQDDTEEKEGSFGDEEHDEDAVENEQEDDEDEAQDQEVDKQAEFGENEEIAVEVTAMGSTQPGVGVNGDVSSQLSGNDHSAPEEMRDHLTHESSSSTDVSMERLPSSGNSAAVAEGKASDSSQAEQTYACDDADLRQQRDSNYLSETIGSGAADRNQSDHLDGSANEEEPKVQRVLFSKSQPMDMTPTASGSQVSLIEAPSRTNTSPQIAMRPTQRYEGNVSTPSANQINEGGAIFSLEPKSTTPPRNPLLSGASTTPSERAISSIEYSTTPSKHLIDSVLSGPRAVTLESIAEIAVTTPVQSRTQSSGRSWGPSFGVSVSSESTSTEEPISNQAVASPLSSWFFSRGPANFKKRVQIPTPGSPRQRIGSPRPSKIARLDAMVSARDFFYLQDVEPNGSDRFVRELLDKSAWRTWYTETKPNELLDPPLPTAMIRRLGGDAAVEAFSKISSRSPIAQPAEEPIVVPRKRKLALTQLEASIQEEKKRARAFDEELLLLLQGKTMTGKDLADEFARLLPGASR